ncbi:MAG: hypothetical protein WBP64_15950 [Nitrososphaeraceae archaeon]
MASIESSRKITRRTRLLKMKTSRSSSKAIEVERIIMHDGFSYFSRDNN